MSKETIQEWFDEVIQKKWGNSKSMVAYCQKKCSDVFKSHSGYLVEFEKPDIKTRFCFGFGYNGQSTSEDVASACDRAANARTNEQYFIDKNLAEYNEWLELLESDEALFLLPSYSGTKACAIRTKSYLWHYQYEEERVVEELNEEDKKNLKEIVLQEKAKFTKRLNTYLKRYGLSKIHSWTYLVD